MLVYPVVCILREGLDYPNVNQLLHDKNIAVDVLPWRKSIKLFPLKHLHVRVYWKTVGDLSSETIEQFQSHRHQNAKRHKLQRIIRLEFPRLNISTFFRSSPNNSFVLKTVTPYCNRKQLYTKDFTHRMEGNYFSSCEPPNTELLILGRILPG